MAKTSPSKQEAPATSQPRRPRQQARRRAAPRRGRQAKALVRRSRPPRRRGEAGGRQGRDRKRRKQPPRPALRKTRRRLPRRAERRQPKRNPNRARSDGASRIRCSPRAAPTAPSGRLPTPRRPAKPQGAGDPIPSPDVEALAHNIAQAIEQGGKVLAAYLRPRESGEIKTHDRRRHRRDGAIDRPGGRILHGRSPAGVRGASGADDPVRRSLGLDAAAPAGRAGCARSPRPTRPTSASPTPPGATIRISISSSRPTC